MTSPFDQTRRLGKALAEPRQEQRDNNADFNHSANTSAPLITMELVEAVLLAGYYRVRGYSIPASGEAVLEAGQMVPVAWRNGQPALILEHSARRASFAPTQVFGITHIEELLLLKIANVWDVWFRDDKFFTPLNLSQYVNHDGTVGPDFESRPFQVKWGEGPNSFVVMTTRSAVWNEGFTPGQMVGVPRFYIFSINRKKTSTGSSTPKASLTTTLSPSPVPSGYRTVVTDPSDPINYANPAPGVPSDIILTKDLDVIMLIEARDVLSDFLGHGNRFRDVLLVWSAKQNSLLSALSGLNDPYAGAPQNATPGFFVATTIISGVISRFFSWSLTDPLKQVVFCEVRHFESTSVFDPDTSLTTLSGTNLRRYVLAFGGDAAPVPLIPDQTGAYSQVVPPALDPSPENQGVTFQLVIGPSSALYALAETMNIVIFNPPVTRGAVDVKARTFVPVTTTPSSAPTTSPNLLRWVAANQLYSVAETKTIPSSILPSQRDELVAFLGGAQHKLTLTPNIILSPQGKLKKQNQPDVAKMKSWLKTLPTVEDAQNSATETVLVSSLARTDYRLIG